MSELPFVRIELDHMRSTIISAMDGRRNELVQEVDRQLKEAIETFDYRKEVSKLAREVVEQEIKKYFTHGQGRMIIKCAVQRALAVALPKSCQEVVYSLYDDDSGRCKVCGAEALWGDAPHDPGCEALILQEGKLL